jgi:hypothetical protein
VVEVPIPHRVAAPSSVDDEMPPFPFRRTAAQGSASELNAPVSLRPVANIDPVGPAVRPQPLRSVDIRPGNDAPRLSPDAVRLLKSTLFELGECRRLLDSGMEDPS